jgi:hypothetical protein
MNSLRGKEPTQGFGDAFNYLNVSPVPDRDDAYDVPVTRNVCNLMRRMQGGAQAMAVEQAALLRHAEVSRRRIISMAVTYLAASQVKAVFDSFCDNHECSNDIL